MATEEVTTQLNVDITQFKTAMTASSRYIREAISEFDKASAGVDGFADSTDGLRAQITKTTKILEAQKVQVAALEEEHRRVVAAQGANSAGAQELAIKINKAEAAVKKTEAALGKYKDKLKQAENDTSTLDDATGQMSAAFGKAASAAGTFAKNLATITGKAIVAGIKSIAAASATLVTAFLANGEATKENITEMAKLDAAYKSAGHSAGTAARTYEELYSVIGETDQAVEASQQIALLAKSEEDAVRWAEMGAGVIGKFGDALQPETFFEAANETFSLNEATGAYVQLIEQCGLSVDEFNKGLAKCKTEQQKQAYMLEYTEKALAGAGEAYRKANAAVIENNKATAIMQAQLNEAGKAALPVSSALKLIGAAILQDLMPNIKAFGRAFKEALSGSKTAAEDMGNAVGGMIQTLVQKFVAALPTVITLGASIITNLVQGLTQAAPAIGSAAAQLVQQLVQAAPQLLSAGGEMVYQLLDGIVSNLPRIMEGAAGASSKFVEGVQKALPSIIAKGGELLSKLAEGIRTAIPSLVSQSLDLIEVLVSVFAEAAPELIPIGCDLIVSLVQGLLDSLPIILERAPEIILKLASAIVECLPLLWMKGGEMTTEIIKGILSAIPKLIATAPQLIASIAGPLTAFDWAAIGKAAIDWLVNGITSMVGRVITAGTNILTAVAGTIQALPGKLLAFGQQAITSLGNAFQVGVITLKTKALEIINGIVNTLQSLPAKMVEIGKAAIQGIINGITSMVGALYDSIYNALSNLVDTAKNALGINSPSKVMRDMVGRWIPSGIAAGIEKYSGVANRAMVDMAKSAVGAANAELAGSTINGPTVNAGGAAGRSGGTGVTYVINQYNNSPKALSRKDIYRQTKNALRFATGNA